MHGLRLARDKVAFTRITPPITPLTTYGFGLPGFYAAKSTRKQSIRRQKPRKAPKITQKTVSGVFGTLSNIFVTTLEISATAFCILSAIKVAPAPAPPTATVETKAPPPETTAPL